MRASQHAESSMPAQHRVSLPFAFSPCCSTRKQRNDTLSPPSTAGHDASGLLFVLSNDSSLWCQRSESLEVEVRSAPRLARAQPLLPHHQVTNRAPAASPLIKADSDDEAFVVKSSADRQTKLSTLQPSLTEDQAQVTSPETHGFL